MSLRESFLAAIAEQPDADGSRQVFADWLDDHGDPDQAEFIRLQMSLAALDECDERRAALAERELELLIEHGMDWARVLVDCGALHWQFRRGTLSWARFTLADFLQYGDEVLERTSVRRFRLNAARDNLADLAASPLLGRVRRLHLGSNRLDDDDLRLLARSPHLGRLEGLHLSDNAFGVAGLLAILGAPSLGRLEKLDLSGPRLGAEGVAALGNCPALSRLRVLRLRYGELNADALRTLGSARGLAELRDLDLDDLQGNEQGLTALVSQGAFPRLSRLSLGRRGPTDEFVEALASSPTADSLEVLRCGDVSASVLAALLRLPRARAAARLWLGLRTLDAPGSVQPSRAAFPGGEFRLESSRFPGIDTPLQMRSCDFPNLRWLGFHVGTVQGTLQHLADWPALGQLSVLDLRNTPLDNGDIRRLADWPQLAGLKRLDVSTLTRANAVDLRPLVRSRHLSNLEMLFISPDSTAEGIRALAGSPLASITRPSVEVLRSRSDWPSEWQRHLSGLHRGCLSLWSERLGDDVMARLAEVPGLSRIHELDMGGNELTVLGLRALLDSPYLTNLRSLRLSFNDALGDEGAALVAGCPKLARLQSLKMSFCTVRDAGVDALASSPYLTDLRVLKLWNNTTGEIGDEGAKAIAGSHNFRRLVGLQLRDNSISDEGAIALAESPHLRDLMHLYLSGNRFGPAGAEALRQRFGARVNHFGGTPYTVGMW